MKFLTFLLILTASSFYAFAGGNEFESWWKEAETLRAPSPEELKRSAAYYQRSIQLKFNDLKKYDARIKKLKSMTRRIEKVLLVYVDKESAIFLVTPENIVKGAKVTDKNADQTMINCKSDKSWVVTLPDNSWSEVDLSPYCLDFYGYNREDIDIKLYWVEHLQKPYIEIITNGPACIPHDLYGWDAKMKRYRKKAEKCTA